MYIQYDMSNILHGQCKNLNAIVYPREYQSIYLTPVLRYQNFNSAIALYRIKTKYQILIIKKKGKIQMTH